jgi:Fe-S-cluster containining protein
MDFDISLFYELDNLYGQLPNTVGCISCGKCCKVQHPHCYFVEFLNMYNHISTQWSSKSFQNLVVGCIERYISNDMEKQCVFLDEGNMCKIYDKRDYNCRVFGIMPKKMYAKRVKAVKKKFSGVKLCLEKQSDCCGGVKPEKYISEKKLDDIFEKIYDLDRKLGISQEDLASSNNYMTFHDHMLLYLYGDNVQFLQQLTHIKVNGSKEDKADFMKEIRSQMEV